MIARHAKDFTWNRGCSSNSPPLKHGDQIPHPLEDSDNQISSSPGRQRCQMPGVCPGGGGHVEASIWPIHKVPGINFSWRHDGQDHPPRDPYRSDWRVHHPPIREYHATRVRNQPKRFSEAGSVMFWVSLPGLPGDTGPNHCDRGIPLWWPRSAIRKLCSIL